MTNITYQKAAFKTRLAATPQVNIRTQIIINTPKAQKYKLKNRLDIKR